MNNSKTYFMTYDNAREANRDLDINIPSQFSIGENYLLSGIDVKIEKNVPVSAKYNFRNYSTNQTATKFHQI